MYRKDVLCWNGRLGRLWHPNPLKSRDAGEKIRENSVNSNVIEPNTENKITTTESPWLDSFLRRAPEPSGPPNIDLQQQPGTPEPPKGSRSRTVPQEQEAAPETCVKYSVYVVYVWERERVSCRERGRIRVRNMFPRDTQGGTCQDKVEEHVRHGG